MKEMNTLERGVGLLKPSVVITGVAPSLDDQVVASELSARKSDTAAEVWNLCAWINVFPV